MRQVPGKGSADGRPRYGFVGDGRVSRHFRHYFGSLGIPWSLWSRRRARVAGSKGPATLARALAGCPVILLAVSDDAIEAVLQELRAQGLGDRSFVHFSGGRSIAGAFGVHPLMSFGPRLYPPPFYRSIPVFAEATAERPDAVARFHDLFPALPNPCYELKSEDKPAYHALCSLAGGVTALIWQRFFETMAARHGAPREALAAYPRRILENVLETPGGAL